MVKIKRGVKLLGLRPEMLMVHLVVEAAFVAIGAECVVTSVCDGTHGRKSRHYSGCAIDYRTRHLDETQKTRLLRLVTEGTEEEVDVVLHTDSPHLHVEWDPK